MMCRYVEEAGNAFGATIVHAMWQDAIENGCIISTDATLCSDSAGEEPSCTATGVQEGSLLHRRRRHRPLLRVLEGGRLPLDNTRSERSLRKNWMFYGSNTHAESAAALFSIIASCRLHAIDPQQYLGESLGLLPYWPKERYLELAPKHWKTTRAKLRADELVVPLGDFTIPAA